MHQQLFDYLSDKHGLTLLQSEMDMIESAVMRDRWNDVSRALPSVCEKVLTLDSDGRLEDNQLLNLTPLLWATENSDASFAMDCSICALPKVTHWMYMPDVPK